MKSEHPFLTSSEDSVFAIMLALSSLSDEEIIRETEICYNALRERFKSRNAVQSLSHVLALYSDGAYTAADRCRNTIALYDALREKGMKYGTEYELATLGTLAMLDCSIEEKVADLDETAVYALIKGVVEAYNATMPAHKRVTKITVRKEPFEKTTSQKIKRKYN
jgi:hypothetical protein